MPAPQKSDGSVGTTGRPRPLHLSEALLASAAREAKTALENGWQEAQYPDDLDAATGEGRR